MRYVVKPSERVYGKRLKWFYRQLSLSINGQMSLPERWTTRPSFRVSARQLNLFMTLYARRNGR